MNFSDDIKKLKPTISEGSCKTYNSLLRTIHKSVFKSEPQNLKNFEKDKPIMQFLDTKPYGTRKTYLAALVVLAPLEIYKSTMMQDIKSYNDNVKKEEMTDKLQESAISTEEINKIAADLKHNADILLKKKSHKLTDLMEIQNYIIMCLYNGYVVPRRALDYVDMLYQNYDPETDNYIDFKKNKMVFNRYKTAKFKGTQELDIPPALKKILQKWVSIIPKEIDNLLFNTNLEPLSNVTLNQRLNTIFGGKKAVNALRHFYLTSKYKDLMEANKKMSHEMEQMGSSIDQAKIYVKVNDKEKG